MHPSEYPTVALFGNDTSEELIISLEMLCEEIVMSPGHRIELLARPSPGLLPISVHQVERGLHVFPDREFDPDWHVRFNGKVLRAQHPLRLSEHEWLL